jgi:putative polyketide hydroxylase
MNARQVVVVGAGPAGLVSAITLARSGVDVLVLERRRPAPVMPRATVLSLRSMELLRAWGLEEDVWRAADSVDMTMLAMASTAHAAEGTVIDVGYPTASQCSVLSPTQAVCVAQDLLEGILRRHLSDLPTAQLATGCEVLAVETHGATRVRVRDAAGHVEWLGTQYVIGADGARSVVRSSLGIALHGSEVALQGARIEFRAPLWDQLGPHRHLIYAITRPDASGVLLPAGQGDRWVFAVTHGPGAEMEDVPSDVALHERLLRAVDLSPRAIEVTRSDRFASGAQMAERFSDGKAFLVGDAAHRVTPRGGTGLNMAVADGYDLGWKLAWVLQGWAPPALLDTYEAERRPAIHHNITRSADPVGGRRESTSELQVDLGGRIKHVWVSNGVSTLDLAGEGLALLTTAPVQECPGTDPARLHPDMGVAPHPPISVVPLEHLTARSLGLGSQGAALLRPDGVLGTVWWSPPSREIVRAAAQSLASGRHRIASQITIPRAGEGDAPEVA